MKRLILIIYSLFLTSCLDTLQNVLNSLKPAEYTSQQSSYVALPLDHPEATNIAAEAEKASNLAMGSMMLGSRSFVDSVLKSVFYSSDRMTQANFMTLQGILDSNLHKYYDSFGGAVDLYSTRGLKEISGVSCAPSTGRCTNDNNQELLFRMSSTPSRSVVLSKTCQAILDQNLFLSEALAKVNVAVANNDTAEVNSSKVSGIYRLFYVDEPDVDSLNALMNGAAEAKSKGFSRLEQWRYVVLMICDSGYWQML